MRKIILLFFFLILFINSRAQTSDYPIVQTDDCGSNAGFESGTKAGWICKYGSYGSGVCPPVGNCPSFSFNFYTLGCLNVTGNNCPLDNNADRHCIMSGSATDPNSNNTVPVVAPGGGNYSFRLGNAIGGGTGTFPNYAQAEAMRLTLLVSPSNAGFGYRYSAFIQDTIHDPESSPRFEVRVLDSADNMIPCGNYSFIAGTSNGYCSTTKDSGTWKKGVGLWQYSDWIYVGLDLSYYIGQYISVEFRTADCYEKDTGICNYKPGPHSAYAYIDAFCNPIPLPPPPDTIICGDSITLCANCPGPIQCSYSWSPGGETTQCITVVVDSATEYTLNGFSLAGCPTVQRIKLICFVGINELSNDESFYIHPNPATSSFVLQLNTRLKDAEVIIYDMLGKEMMRKKFVGDRMEVEKGNLTRGVYFTKVRAGEKEFVQKLVLE